MDFKLGGSCVGLERIATLSRRMEKEKTCEGYEGGWGHEGRKG